MGGDVGEKVGVAGVSAVGKVVGMESESVGDGVGEKVGVAEGSAVGKVVGAGVHIPQVF